MHGNNNEYYLWHRGATEEAINLTSEVEGCPSITLQPPLGTPECPNVALREEIIQDDTELSEKAEIYSKIKIITKIVKIKRVMTQIIRKQNRRNLQVLRYVFCFQGKITTVTIFWTFHHLWGYQAAT